MKLTKSLIKKTFLLIYYLICHPVTSWRVFSAHTKKRIIKITAVILIVTVGTPISLWYGFYRHSNEAKAAWPPARTGRRPGGWNDLWLLRIFKFKYVFCLFT